MINPVQRIARYALLLRDVEKAYSKSGREDLRAVVSETVEITSDIANYVNDMMMAGRIQKFQVNYGYICF